jgi:hypothetical protein
MHLESKIIESLDNISDRIVGSVNSATHCKLVQGAFRQFGAKVRVALDHNISDDAILVTGEYSPWRTRQNIEVYLTYNSGAKRLPITKKIWKVLKFDLSQVLQHELIHRRQCRHIEVPKEDWADHTCKIYASKSAIPYMKVKQEYYGSTEEIEAHAHCIMMELKHFAPRTDPIKMLRGAKKIPQKKSPTMKDYLETFDFDMKHPVIKRLFKKIVYWIENQEA